jgi:hypothetical protein
MARSMAPFYEEMGPCGEGQIKALAEWLRGGGHGGNITTLYRTDYFFDDDVNRLIRASLRRGALPSLKSAPARLMNESDRALLEDGLLAPVHELRLYLESTNRDLSMRPQLAALGLVRQLPALTKLHFHVYGVGEDTVQWPPFIPPSLKALRIVIPWDLSLLRALPGMLEASGARLERLEVTIPSDHKDWPLVTDWSTWPRPCAAARPRSRASFSAQGI